MCGHSRQEAQDAGETPSGGDDAASARAAAIPLAGADFQQEVLRLTTQAAGRSRGSDKRVSALEQPQSAANAQHFPLNIGARLNRAPGAARLLHLRPTGLGHSGYRNIPVHPVVALDLHA